VNPTEPPAKPASTPKAGLFATLHALLHAQGSGAPSRTHLHGTGAPSAARARLAVAFATCASLIAILAILLTSVAPASASETCPNEARREEQGAAGRALPDCRAYELVTQPYQPGPQYNQKSILGFPPSGPTQLPGDTPEPINMPATETGASPSRDGNTVLYNTNSEPNWESDSLVNDLSRRGPGGWAGENIDPPRSRHGFLCNGSGYVGFSLSLEQIVIWSGPNDVEECGGHFEPPLVPGESQLSKNLFLRDTTTHIFQLVNVTPEGAKPYDPYFVGMSADGSNIAFVSRAQLTADAPNGEALVQPGPGYRSEGHCASSYGNTYIWSAGAVHLPTVLPDGSAVRGILAGILATTCDAHGQNATFTNSLSADGNRILFYAGGGRQVAEDNTVTTTAPYLDGGLYLRQHPTAEQSALAHGGARGAGTLTAGSKEVTSLLAATGAANLVEGSDELTVLHTRAGEFHLGQTVAGEGIPPATFVAGLVGDEHGYTLTLSAAVEAGKSGTEVPITATGPQSPFAAGQTITGKGIPPATTIAAVGAGTLTLSNNATANETEVALEASSECTEPAKACTVQIDVPESGASGSPGDGQFQWANAETTKVFFTDVEQLTSDSTAEAGKPDLYEYDLEKPAGERLTDLTANAGEPADVLGVSGASADGSYLYFAAHADLTGAQQNSHGAVALAPAAGTGTLSGAANGTGTPRNSEITELSVSSGQFREGQGIAGGGIEPGTTITGCSPDCSAPTALTLSRPVLSNGAHPGEEIIGLTSNEVTALNTTSGAFHEDMAISGPGISPNTRITAVGPGTLILSRGSSLNGTASLSATAANLYLRHGGTTTFIATLSELGGDRCDWTALCLSSRVSSNGAFIAFDSIDSITGYDNHPVHPEACAHLTEVKNSPCIEAFRYAAASGAHGELTCAACNPAGPPSSEFAWSLIATAATMNISPTTSAIDFSLSDSGQVFFSTMEKLVPADENEVSDVYEYSGGEGPSAQLHLISSGKSELPSYFMEATPDGSNIFFVTVQALLRSDTRSDYDLYDARVGGGFAEPLIPPCEGEGCHPAYPGVPGSSSPASASFEGKGNVHPAGTGNPHPAKCKKGFVKKKGKCVKQRKKKSKKAKKKKSKKSIRRVAK
jgi:hypothetical protein